MLIDESQDRLTELLTEAGLADGPPWSSFAAFLEVFATFAAIPADNAAPADEDGDALLAEYGTFDVDGPEEFSVSITRQFIEASEDPDDAEIWQLRAQFTWDPSEETVNLGGRALRSFGMPLDQFFADAQALPGWGWALRDAPPARDVQIDFDVV